MLARVFVFEDVGTAPGLGGRDVLRVFCGGLLFIVLERIYLGTFKVFSFTSFVSKWLIVF